MAGQNASVNVTFTSSGAGSVIGDAAAVSAALSSIHGGSASVSYESKGGSGAVAEARAFDQSLRGAGAAAADAERGFNRVSRETSGVGREARTAQSHVKGLSGELRSMAGLASAAGEHMALSGGARDAQRQISGASRDMRALESGAGRAAVAVRSIAPASGGGLGGGAIKDAVIDMHKLSDGTYGVAEGMKAIGAGGGSRSGGFSYAEGINPRAEGVYSKAHAEDMQRGPGGGNAFAERLRETRAAATGAAESLDMAAQAGARVGSAIGGALTPNMGKLSNAGWTAMGALGAFTGVMSSATEHSVDMAKTTAGMGMNLQGMQNMIGRVQQQTAHGIMGGQLSAQDAQLREMARTTTRELGPAIQSTAAAASSFEGAKMGSMAQMAPQIKGFADTVKANAPGIQSMLSGIGSTALSLGSDTVAGLAQAAPAFQSLANTVAANAPQITSMVTQVANGLAQAGQLTSNVAGHLQSQGDTDLDTIDSALGVRRDPRSGAVSSVGHWGDYDYSGSGANAPKPGSQAAAGRDAAMGYTPTGGGATGYRTPSGFDPSKPYSGAAVMPDGSVQTGPGNDATARRDTAQALGQQPRSAAERAQAEGSNAGKSASQIYAEQYKAGTGAAPGAARYNGLGAPPGGGGGETPHQRAVRQGGDAFNQRLGGGGAGGSGLMGSGPGSSVSSVAAHAQALQTLQRAYQSTGQSAQTMSSSTSSAANSLGQSTQQGAQRAAQSMHAVPPAMASVAPAAAVSGAQVGASLGSGMSQGTQRSESVTDSVMRRHISKVTDMASSAASAGGQSIGNAMGTGTASGMTQSETVTDNVVRKHVKKIVDIMADALGIKSPSRVTATRIGAPMGEGVGSGFANSVSSVGSSMAASGRAMSMALQGPMDDYGLQVGSTYAQSFIDGSSRVLKSANTKSLGMPDNLSPNAMSNLAGTGLLQAGSGASTWKTNSGGPGVVTIGGATPVVQQTIHVFVDGTELKAMAEVVATQVTEDAMNRSTGTYATL